MHPRQQICAILHLVNCLLMYIYICAHCTQLWSTQSSELSEESLFQRCASDLKDGEDGREGEEGGGQRKGEHKKKREAPLITDPQPARPPSVPSVADWVVA